MPSLVAELQAVVEIGGLPIRFQTDSPQCLDLIRGRYSKFLSERSEWSADITMDLVPSEQITSEEEITVRNERTKWIAARPDFHLNWDSETKRGVLRQWSNPYALEAAIRILHTLLLADQGGFLLHAASAARNGKAFLFFGPSGAGKTTMARTAPADAILLTDEISYVRRVDDTYIAYGTPFAGEMAKLGENVSAPIAGLYHLVQAQHNRLTPVAPAEAGRLLLECILFLAQEPELVNRVFQSACDVVSRLPIYRLEFVPDERVWDLLS